MILKASCTKHTRIEIQNRPLNSFEKANSENTKDYFVFITGIISNKRV